MRITFTSILIIIVAITASGQQGQYETRLTPREESVFQQWKQRHAPNDSGEDYDFRGAFKAGLKPDRQGHWSDRFKKPNHPTFSIESQYATGVNRARAGRWKNGKFIPVRGGNVLRSTPLVTGGQN